MTDYAVTAIGENKHNSLCQKLAPPKPPSSSPATATVWLALPHNLNNLPILAMPTRKADQ